MYERKGFWQSFDELLHGKEENQESSQAQGEDETKFGPQPSSAHLAALNSVYDASPHQSPEATITSDMVIKGTVTSTSNINVFGTILGDVVCENDMTVSGHIEGNISARSFQLVSGSISGDIVAKSLVEVAQGSSINGNVSAERIIVDSKVTGNLNATQAIRLNGNAIIDGNIKAGSLSIQEGAELKGNVDIHIVHDTP